MMLYVYEQLGKLTRLFTMMCYNEPNKKSPETGPRNVACA